MADHFIQMKLSKRFINMCFLVGIEPVVANANT